jgi:hypothetical protein
MTRGITIGFLAAAAMNVLGVLIFSKGLTGNSLGEWSPDVFGRFGLIGVMLWGLAYASVATRADRVPQVCLVFAIEKAIYTVTWVLWWSQHSAQWPAIWSADPLTAAFYVIYGMNDLAFGLFFAWVAWKFSPGMSGKWSATSGQQN